MSFHILQTGVSHKTAPLALREKLAFPQDRIEHGLRTLADIAGVRESLILSTCNRTELYCVTDGDRPSYAELEAFLTGFHRIPELDISDSVVRRAGHRAVTHILEVAAGLDSLVIGENEILGQVKRAYSTAVGVGPTGPILNKLLHVAFTTGKQVRTETGICQGSLSIARLACMVVVDRHRSGESPTTVLLLGAGATGRQTARILREQIDLQLVIASRSSTHAQALADDLGAATVPLDRFPERLRSSNVVISATDSSDFIVRREQVEVARRDIGRPLLILDLAIPRDVDPAVASLPNVELVNIDALRGVAEKHLAVRKSEINAARRIVDTQARKFADWGQRREQAAGFREMRVRFEEIRKAILAESRPEFSDDEFRRTNALTKSLVDAIARSMATYEAGASLHARRKKDSP